MRAKLSLPFFLLPVVLLAAEDFESYPTAEAMRQVWLEFDAGNPPPERVEIGTLHGKALHVTAKRDYSLLCREMRNLRGAEATGLTLTLRGDAANPKDAVMTVILRTEKNGAELGRKVVPLCSAAAQSVTIPARALGGRERFTLLLMFNKTGGTLNATVDEIEIAAAKREKIDGFDRAGDSAGLRRENVAAIVTENGGTTSHSAILARTMSMPAVLSVPNITEILSGGETLVVDGSAGTVLVNPDEDVLRDCRARQGEEQARQADLLRFRTRPTHTADGEPVSLCCNITSPRDVPNVLEHTGEGVGLFRTEFLYMESTDFPSEEEQFESVVLPLHLERIGNRAFCNSGIQRIEFPLTLKEIGIAAFQRNKLTSVILPDSVVTLGGGAFGTNPQLEQIILSRGLTEIPAGAFGCSTADEWMDGLTEIEIPEGITVIGNNAFAGNNFTQINIPSTVKEIGSYAFSTKNYLKDTVCTVTLPEGLEKIGTYAFRNKIVETLDLPETVKAFPANVFTREYSDSTQAMVTLVYVNETQISDKTNFPDSEYHKFVLRDDPSDTVWSAYDFTYGEVTPKKLYDVAMTEKVEVSGWGVTGFTENGLKKLGRNPELIIPEKDPEGRQVTAVADNAFKYDADTMPQKITSVTFPQNVKAGYEGQLSDKNERGNFLIMGMAFYGQGLKEVTLPEGVLLVGRQAFAKNELTHVTLPETVWWIEQGAFFQNQITIVDFPETCDFKLNMDAQALAGNQIVSVALPDRTEKVNKWAFLQNTGKEPVAEGSSAEKKGGIVYMYGDEALASEGQIAHMDNEGNKSNVQKLVIDVQDPAEQPWNTIHFIYDGTKVTGLSEAGQAKRAVDQHLRIPDLTPDGQYVTEIGNGGAYGTFGAEGESFESVTLPSQLQVIGNSAFAQNTMTKLDLPSTLTTIGSAAFRASGLTEVVLPDSVTKVGAGAFTTCADLEKVTLSPNMTQIEQSVFAMTAIKEVTIPEGVTEIGRMAFNGAPVESLVIPGTVTEIGANAFATNRLTELTIPGSVKSIGSSAFSQYSEQSPSSLKTLVLGEGLEEIGKTAFRKCALTSVEIPSTLASLAKNSFQDGAAGQVILYSKNPAHLQETDTFIPESEGHKVVYSNLIGTGWSYDDFTFDGSVLTGWSDKGNVTRKEVKNLVLPQINPETGEAVTEIGENAFKIPDDEIEQLKDSVYSPNGMETVSIPETVTKIGKKAFEYNNFVEMGFGAAVTEIGESAFHGNKLTKVVIPDNVTALGAGAFSENNITDLTLSKNVTVIPQGAFSMNIRLEQVTIPDTVTEIGEMAFAGARLTSLEIPASVEKIGRKAFHLHHLTELTVPGNVKEIGESAFEGTFKAITLRSRSTLSAG